MKRLVWLCVALGSAAAYADWLVLTGTPDQPDTDTIQVDPLALDAVGNQRTLRIRVNRAHVVADPDGLQYRSMMAEATVDCRKRTAGFLHKIYFAEPNLSGPAIHQRFFGKRSAPPLQFDGIPGNYPVRLINAACKVAPWQG